MNYDFYSTPAPRRALALMLAEMETAELIRRGDKVSATFAFKHVLGQDTAYSTLTRAERKRLHRRVAASERDMATVREICQRIGGRLVLALWLDAAHAESLLRATRAAEARVGAEQTRDDARAASDILAQSLSERVLGQIVARTEPTRAADADAHFAASLRLFQEGDARLEAARTHIVWGKWLRADGRAASTNVLAARTHFEQAAAQFEISGLVRELAEARALLNGAAA